MKITFLPDYKRNHVLFCNYSENKIFLKIFNFATPNIVVVCFLDFFYAYKHFLKQNHNTQSFSLTIFWQYFHSSIYILASFLTAGHILLTNHCHPCGEIPCTCILADLSKYFWNSQKQDFLRKRIQNFCAFNINVQVVLQKIPSVQTPTHN